MYCQGATESINGFNSEFNGKSITAKIVLTGGFCFPIFSQLVLSKKSKLSICVLPLPVSEQGREDLELLHFDK